MSYDIWLEIDTGGDQPAVIDQDWNYTSNCSPMWRLAGANLADYDGELAGDCLPSLRSAIEDMEADPAKYLPLNPGNGWGSLESLIPALEELAAMFAAHPKATVRVGR